MPKITEITPQSNKKDRYNLFIDGEFRSGISLETLMKFRLKVNMEVDKEELDSLLKENERHEAFEKSINYISKRLKTKREIKDYLFKKGYSEDVVWYCIDRLKEYGYVDDAEYSKRYIESASKNQGKRLTEYKLMMKGVKKDDILLAYDACELNENESARVVAEKHIKNKERTKENIAKTYRYLIGKGFTYDQASYAIEKLKEEE